MTFIMKWVKRATAAVAAVMMAVSLSACESNLSWAAKIGEDTTLPVGLYIYSQAAAYRNGGQSGVIDVYSELKDQTVTVSGSDMAATAYLDREAQKTVKSAVGTMLKAEEMGISLDEDKLNSAMQSAAEEYEANEEMLTKNGVAQTSVEEYYKDLARKNDVFQAIYGEDGTNPVSDDTLKKFMEENYATFHFMQQYLYTEDGSPMTAQEIANVKKKYEKIRSNAEKGKLDFKKKCDEESKNNTGYVGAYTDITQRFDPTDEQGKAVLSLKTGEFYLMETDSTIALIQKAKLDKNGKNFEQSRDTLLLESTYDAFIDEMVKYAEKSDKVTFNDKAFEKFASSTRDFSGLNMASGS